VKKTNLRLAKGNKIKIMPKITLKYASEDEIPSELKQFKVADKLEVEVSAGTSQDAVATELNAPLAQSRDKILDEKKKVDEKYTALLTSSAQTATELKEAQVKLASATGVSPEELQIIQTVKAINPTIKTDDLKTALTEFPKVQSELQTIKQEQEIGSLSRSVGFTNDTVFQTVWNNDAFNPNRDSVVWKDETVDNKAVKTPYVKLKTPVDGKIEIPLKEYAEKTAEWTPFMPALTPQDSKEKSWLPQTPQTQVQPIGGGSSLGDIIANENKSNMSRPSALYTPKPEQPKTN
jgi:hypothetical protein